MTGAKPAPCQRIGLRIRAARDEAGMTQDHLAQLIGLGRSSVANIELGNQDTSVTRLAIIAEVLNLDLADLVREGDLPPRPHDVRIRRVYEVTCETCDGLVIDCTGKQELAAESRREHIAAMRAPAPLAETEPPDG